MNETISCRPLREGDLPFLERMIGDPEVLGRYAWFGWNGAVPGMRRKWSETGLITQDGGLISIVLDDEPIGIVTWHKMVYNPISYSWNLGMCLLPEYRGKSRGSEACRWIVGYLFAHTQANRIEAHADPGNIASHVVLKAAGFTREGVLRGAAYQDGRWRDLVVYGILRDEPPGHAAAPRS